MPDVMNWEGLTIPLDERLGFFHLGKQVGITDDSSGISDFSTSLVQTGDDPDNSSFGYVCQLDDFREWLRLK